VVFINKESLISSHFLKYFNIVLKNIKKQTFGNNRRYMLVYISLKNLNYLSMRTMRLFAVLVLSLLMTSSFAQQGQGQGQGQRQQRTPEERAKTQVEWMAKDLSLDQATQTKVSDIFVKYYKKTAEERQKLTAANTDRETMRTKLAEVTAAQDKELKAILGDQKFELYQKKLAERRAAAQNRNQ
jgi:periplasmic protein CpxP/Spy